MSSCATWQTEGLQEADYGNPLRARSSGRSQNTVCPVARNLQAGARGMHMRSVGIPKGILVTAAVLGALLSTLTAAPARADSFTFDSGTNAYTYIGDVFNFCGFGCP